MPDQRPCVVVPTFWTRRRGRFPDRIINVYDHPTPMDSDGTLPACLESLAHVKDLGQVVIIVAATEPGIEAEAEDRVRELLGETHGVEALIFGAAELGSLHRRLEQLEFDDMLKGVSLTGYGAVRNLGLIVAAVLGHETVVFVDDDQVILSPDFIDCALEGLGEETKSGDRILAKSGYYVDSEGRYQSSDHAPWSDILWRQSDAYNAALMVVDTPPRIRRSPIALGGCLALHRDMFTKVSFDPWVVRGEDVDYVINARLHGEHVYLDGKWRVVHNPPQAKSEALYFRQDVYRFVYEHRKLEFAKSQVDLQRVTHESLRPYPGEFVGGSIGWRAFATALLRALSGREPGAYLKVAWAPFGEANRYAREHCDDYFSFQRRWPELMDGVWEDIALKTLFTGERSVDRSAITGRFPVIRSDD
jgi:GT2 family glycosyltransferase